MLARESLILLISCKEENAAYQKGLLILKKKKGTGLCKQLAKYHDPIFSSSISSAYSAAGVYMSLCLIRSKQAYATKELKGQARW